VGEGGSGEGNAEGDMLALVEGEGLLLAEGLIDGDAEED